MAAIGHQPSRLAALGGGAQLLLRRIDGGLSLVNNLHGIRESGVVRHLRNGDTQLEYCGLYVVQLRP